jgi:DNA-directed RNA polymerase specialized sigma24 family protein
MLWKGDLLTIIIHISIEYKRARMDGQFPETLARALVDSCTAEDYRWRDGESSASSVYDTILPRFHRKRSEIKNEEAWIRTASTNLAREFHVQLRRQACRRPLRPFDEHHICLGHPRAGDPHENDRVHPSEHERFITDAMDDSEDERRILKAFDGLPEEHRQLIGAKLRLPGFRKLAEIARAENVSRQSAHQRASRLLKKWKRACDERLHKDRFEF